MYKTKNTQYFCKFVTSLLLQFLSSYFFTPDVPEVSEVVIVAQERQPVESTPLIFPQDLSPSNSNINNSFKFSSFHGGQVAVSADCRSAVRVNPLCEFNNAIVMSHRPLEDDEMFEVIVEKIVTCWSGSVEAGAFLLLMTIKQ